MGFKEKLSSKLNNSQLQLILERLNSMDQNLQDLMNQVAQNTSVEGSAVTLIQGIAAQLTAALANSDSAALPALTAQLSTSANALAAAITANTPTPVGSTTSTSTT